MPVLLVGFAFSLCSARLPAEDERPASARPPTTAQAWTLPDALLALRRNPDNVYLQYVALQLARAADRVDEVVEVIDSGQSLLGEFDFSDFNGAGEDVFPMLNGMEGRHRQLQTEIMQSKPQGENADGPPPPQAEPVPFGRPVAPAESPPILPYGPTPPSEPEDPEAADVDPVDSELITPPLRVTPRSPYYAQPTPPAYSPPRSAIPNSLPSPALSPAFSADPIRADAESRPAGETTGSTTGSRSWEEMLAERVAAGHKAEVSPLAMAVPADQYFAVVGSLGELLDASGVWVDQVFADRAGSAKTGEPLRRLMRQLAIQSDATSRPVFEAVVDEVAVTGSDLRFRNGGDVSVLFQVSQPAVFRFRMESLLATAEKSHPDAVRSTGKILGVDYTAVTTADRSVNVFSAYPKPNLHVRSNSKIALQRVLEAIAGKTADGAPVRRLGETAEFQYVRTLMPRGAEEEDCLIHLSTSFAERFAVAQSELLDKQRMAAYNHLRMIGHAAMLYRTQFGRPAESLEQLAESGCAPGVFGQDDLACPAGGTYRLAADGFTGVSSVFGSARHLTPSCEIPRAESAVEDPEQDPPPAESSPDVGGPLAVKIGLTPERCRMEVLLVLPVEASENNEILDFLGEPRPFHPLLNMQSDVFSIALKWNKRGLLQDDDWRRAAVGDLFEEEFDTKILEDFLTRGIGDQISLHLCDFEPPVGIDPQPTGMALMGALSIYLALVAPSYLEAPVDDAAAVDAFLGELDRVVSGVAQIGEIAGMRLGLDYYTSSSEGTLQNVRCIGLCLGPIRFRIFLVRLDKGLYVTNRRWILDELIAAQRQQAAAEAEGIVADPGPVAQAIVHFRPENAKKFLASVPLSRTENDRMACLQELCELSPLARALAARGEGPVTIQELRRQAEELGRVYVGCPDGGKHGISADGRQVTCSVHGSAAAPRQPFSSPDKEGPLSKISDATLEFSMSEEVLRGVLTIDRK